MMRVKYNILPIFLFFALISSDCQAQPPCGKFYLVIDGGDKEVDGSVAKSMARDADSIALWLIDNGFKGIRRSQYGKSAHPPIANKYELREIILDYKDKLKCPPGAQCCHELFIYINAHGAAEGFEIHDRTGKSSPSNPFYDDDLVKVLKELPDCVKLTIFLDVCYSGGAIKWLKPLCEKFGKCGVTIITACDANSETPAGVNIDSATEDFMEGASDDNDGDGDKGDIRDRLLEMQNELGNNNPQMEMCDGQTRMCSLEKLPGIMPTTPQGVLYPPMSGPLVATVRVREKEKAYLSQHVGGQAVATVLVNDEPQELPEPDEGIPVSPGDVIQLVNAVGTLLGHFTFTPEEEAPPPVDKAPVVECPSGQPAVVSVPGDYADTPIEDMVVTTAPVETALTTGPEGVPAVTAPEGEVAVALPGRLEPVLKTDDTVVVAGNLGDSAIGSSEVTVTDKNTGAVLRHIQIDMWRLAGASLNPPVVDKGGETNLRLNIFGPPDLQVEVTATAGEGLIPRKVTATAPISVLQSHGIGSFTATKSGTHNVSIRASTAIEGKEPVMGLPAWR